MSPFLQYYFCISAATLLLCSSLRRSCRTVCVEVVLTKLDRVPLFPCPKVTTLTEPLPPPCAGRITQAVRWGGTTVVYGSMGTRSVNVITYDLVFNQKKTIGFW